MIWTMVWEFVITINSFIMLILIAMEYKHGLA